MDNLNDKIPGLRINTHTGDNYEFKSIDGEIKLPAWIGFQSRQGAYASRTSEKQSDGTIRLVLGGDAVSANPVVTQEQVNAYYYLLQKQDIIKQAILISLLAAYKDLQEQYGYEGEDADTLMPDVADVSGFKSLIGLSTVHLLAVSKDGVAYTGYEFGCTWDEEHGLGVMTHKDRVIEIGGADTSFLSWIAEKDLDPINVNAEIEANYKNADDSFNNQQKQQEKKPWWKFW